MQGKALCVPSLEAHGRVAESLVVENRQKVDNFEPVGFGYYDTNEKKFVFFELLITFIIVFITPT